MKPFLRHAFDTLIALYPHCLGLNRDLTCILGLDIDWVALSFVQRPQDVDELRALAGPKVKIMAKLEKPSAMDSLAEVRQACTAIFTHALLDIDCMCLGRLWSCLMESWWRGGT